MPWNIWYNVESDSSNNPIPFAIFYTPGKAINPIFLMDATFYQNICKCGGYLNPFVIRDFKSNIWICSFCSNRNQINNEINSEITCLHQMNNSTFEHTVTTMPNYGTTAYIFVIDTNFDNKNFSLCKAAIVQASQLIAKSSILGLISFGSYVSIHEISLYFCPKAHVFYSSREKDVFDERIGFKIKTTIEERISNFKGLNKFMLPVSECLDSFINITKILYQDPKLMKLDKRPFRCTGSAIQIATTLLSTSCKFDFSRIMLFTCGTVTLGPGKIVDVEYKKTIRSHQEINDGDAYYYKSSKNFYRELTKDLVKLGAALDCFICSSDQVGLVEMKDAIQRSGGITLFCDSFESESFKKSFRCLFEPDNKEGYSMGMSQGSIKVICSHDLKVAGVSGPGVIDRAQNNYTWRIPHLSASTTVCIIFNIMGLSGKTFPEINQKLFIQFITRYNTCKGEMRNRVTTLTRLRIENFDFEQLILGFDPEAAAVVLGRLCSFRMDTEKLDVRKTTKWLDKSLIDLCDMLWKNKRNQFCFPPILFFFAQLIYYLRRSHFVQIFNNSPDQVAYHRLIFNWQTVNNSLLMFQPILKAYFLKKIPELVPPNFSSLQRDRILVLDAYHIIVVFFGSSIVKWCKAGYNKRPEFREFAQLLQILVSMQRLK